MVAAVIIVGVALVFAVIWMGLAKNPGKRARLGPDGTNVRESETFVVHHKGKGQGLDIANVALKERTEHISQDLPGDARKVKTRIPGRDMTRPSATPPDASEEPGRSHAKGRRVTGTHRDVELAADLLPNVYPDTGRRAPRNTAASPVTDRQEPGYGLGRAHPGDPEGEGGYGAGDQADPYPTEQPDLTDDLPDLPEGDMLSMDSASDSFQPDPSRDHETAGELSWAGLYEEIPLPETYGVDTVIAMVRNPRSLYVYWELSGSDQENIRQMLGEAWHLTTPVLRVFDVTSGAYPGQPYGRSFAIQVGEHDDHWFINENIEPGRRYVVSYERRTADGEYYLIGHSAAIQTPHQGPAKTDALYEQYGNQPGHWLGSPWR